jgi:hypothetical protein
MIFARHANLVPMSRFAGDAHRRCARRARVGFTMLELQVAIILLAFGVVTLASLMTTQARVLKHVQGDFKPDATIYITRSNDPWVKKLSTPARITADVLTQSAASTVTAANTVSIVSQEQTLATETITVTADVTELP